MTEIWLKPSRPHTSREKKKLCWHMKLCSQLPHNIWNEHEDSSPSTSFPHPAKAMHKWSHLRWDFHINIAWPLRDSFSYAQEYSDFWPQTAKPFQHLVRLIKLICKRAWRELDKMDVEGLHLCVCGGVCLWVSPWNFARSHSKLPRGPLRPLSVSVLPEPLERKHSPTHAKLGAPTLIRHDLQRNLYGLY